MDALPVAAEPVIASPAVPRRAVALRRLGAALAVVALIEALAILAITSMGVEGFVATADLSTAGFLGSVLLFPAMGALIIGQRPYSRVAWLMVAIGLALGTGLLASGYGIVGLPPREPVPLGNYLLILSQVFFPPIAGVAFSLLLLVYPTDRLPSERWSWFIPIAIGGAALYAVSAVIDPSLASRNSLPGFVNPLAAPASMAELIGATSTIGNAIVTGSIALAALSLAMRYRHSSVIESAQIRWIALVAIIAAAAFAVASFQVGPVSDLGFGIGILALAVLPIAVGFAITRYRLYEIDRLINRAIVYGSLTAILAGVFTAAIGLAQRLFVALTGESSDGAIVLTTLVVATLYAPLRKRLETIVDRRFKYDVGRFGAYRNQVNEVLSVVEPTRAAERLISTAVDEFGAVGGAILDRAGAPVATAGSWPTPQVIRLAFPGGTPLAALVVGPRADGQPHDPRAIVELEDMVRLVASALRTAGDAH
jgi:hypothetical protein